MQEIPTLGAVRVGHLIHRWPTNARRPDGYPHATHHMFAVYAAGQSGPPYPICMTVEVSMADGSSSPVLACLEKDARRRLEDMFAASMRLGVEASRPEH